MNNVAVFELAFICFLGSKLNNSQAIKFAIVAEINLKFAVYLQIKCYHKFLFERILLKLDYFFQLHFPHFLILIYLLFKQYMSEKLIKMLINVCILKIALLC